MSFLRKLYKYLKVRIFLGGVGNTIKSNGFSKGFEEKMVLNNCKKRGKWFGYGRECKTIITRV